MLGRLYNLCDFCMIAVSMGNLAQKKWIERVVPTQKDPIVIDGNRENPEKSCNSSGFTENGKRRSSKNLFFFCWRNQIFQQSNPFYSVSNRDSQNEKYQSYHWLINFCSVVFPDKYLRFIGDILKHCGQCSIMKVKSNLKFKANISP